MWPESLAISALAIVIIGLTQCQPSALEREIDLCETAGRLVQASYPPLICVPR